MNAPRKGPCLPYEHAHVDRCWEQGWLACEAAQSAAPAGVMSDGLRTEIEAALTKVDKTWGGAAMVVKDTVLSILGRRCTNEFCEHDHAAIRELRANPPQDAGEGVECVCGWAEGRAGCPAHPATQQDAGEGLDEARVAAVLAEHGHWAAMQNSDRPGDFVCQCGLPWTPGAGCAFAQGVAAIVADHTP